MFEAKNDTAHDEGWPALFPQSILRWLKIEQQFLAVIFARSNAADRPHVDSRSSFGGLLTTRHSRRVSVVARRVPYKGCVIKSTPEPIAASGQWRLRIAIYWKANGMLNMQPFSGPAVYNKEEEANIDGIAYGQRIIDEKAGLKRLTVQMVGIR
jgi:hypothetical protein